MLSDKQLLDLVRGDALRGVVDSDDWLSDNCSIQPASIDLHIGGIYLPGKTASEAGGEERPLREYLIGTGNTVLISTAEELNLPVGIGGFAFPPSSFAAKALLITNPGHVDPEYRGPLRFTLINMGHEEHKLQMGEKIGTLVLFRLDRPCAAGWFTRHKEEGRLPNTEDLHWLSVDFAEVTKRAQDIAQQEVSRAQLQVAEVERRWNRRIGVWGAVAAILGAAIVAFFTWYSPFRGIDTRLNLMEDNFNRRTELENRLNAVDNQLETLKANAAAMNRQLQQLEQSTKPKVNMKGPTRHVPK